MVLLKKKEFRTAKALAQAFMCPHDYCYSSSVTIGNTSADLVISPSWLN